MDDTKKLVVLTTIFLLIISFLIAVWYLKNNTVDYHMGESVSLIDGSTWKVIEDTKKKDKYILLLCDEALDLNEDGISNDSMAYNSNNSNHDFQNSDIAEYLMNVYMPKLVDYQINFGTEGEIRLITLEELLKIGDYKKDTDASYKLEKGPSFLGGKEFGNYGYYWTMSRYQLNSSDVWTVTDKGDIIRDNASSAHTNSVRPVLKLLKTNL